MSDTPPAGFPIVAPGLGLRPEDVQARVEAQPDIDRAKLLAQQGQEVAASSEGNLTFDSTDPPYITAMEHFEGLSHAEIHDKVEAMSIGAITALGAAWRKIANGLSAKVVGSRLALNRALSEGFGGEFAATAATAADSFFDGADNLQRVVSSVGFRIGSVAGAAEAVQLSVPAPPAATGGTPTETEQIVTTILGVASPSAAADSGRQQEEARQVAIGVMNSVYKPTYQPAGDGVPTFVPVYAPGDGPAGTNPAGTNTNSPGTPGSTTEPPAGGTPSEQPGQQPGTEDPQETTAASTETPAGNTPTQQQTATTPSTTTTPGDTPRGTPTGTTTPGTPSSPGTPGAPGTPGSPSAPPVPGRNVAGTPGNPAAPGATTAASNATRAGRPMTGMPGMMSPGAARRGEDDQDHKIPDYLIIDRSEELLGAEQPMVPPTIGDDATAAEPARDQGGHR